MKKGQMKIVSIVLTLILLFVGLAGCGNGGEPADNDGATTTPPDGGSSPEGDGSGGEKQVVKVGVCMPLSGNFIRTGQVATAGIGAALQHIEEDGFLENYTLEVTYYDDLGTPDGCPPAASLLINDGNHVAISNHMTVNTMAVMDMYEDAGVICMGPISGVAAFSQGWDYFYMTTCSDLDITKALADYIDSLGYERVFVQARNDEGGMGGAQAFIDYIEGLSGEGTVVGYELFATDDTDFTAQVLTAKDVDAQIFYSAGTTGANTYTLWKQIRDLWADDIILVGNTSMADSLNPEIWGYDDIEGVLFQTAYVYDETDPMLKRFNDTVIELDPEGLPPAEFSGRCYDAVWDIAYALDALGEYDVNAEDFVEKLNQSMKTVKRTGVLGEIDFAAFGDGRSIATGKVAMWHADGKAEQVWPVKD